jgi:hypothetical protein
MPPFYELGGSVANTGEPWSQQRRRRCVRRDRPGHAARKPDSHQRASLSQGVGIPPYSGPTNGNHENHFRRGYDGAAHRRFRDIFGSGAHGQGGLSCRARSCNTGYRPWAQTRLGARKQDFRTARISIARVVWAKALVDAAMPPITRAGKIWIDDALRRAA